MRPPILRTRHFTFRPYRQQDEDRFAEIALDAVSTHFMGGSTGDETEERKLFRKAFETYESNDKRWF